MTKQQHTYYRDPDRVDVSTRIVDCRLEESAMWIAAGENAMRAAGGGEPRDLGMVGFAVNDNEVVLDLVKRDGLTWMVMLRRDRTVSVGDEIKIHVDPDHRERRRRYHTGVHLCLRSVCDVVQEVQVLEAEISPEADKAFMLVRTRDALSPECSASVDIKMRSWVLANRPVDIIQAKSLDHAEAQFGTLLRVSDRHAFSGKVRLVHIAGIDLNPCSGLHHSTTDIGPYTLDFRPCEGATTEIVLTLTPAWQYWYGG